VSVLCGSHDSRHTRSLLARSTRIDRGGFLNGQRKKTDKTFAKLLWILRVQTRPSCMCRGHKCRGISHFIKNKQVYGRNTKSVMKPTVLLAFLVFSVASCQGAGTSKLTIVTHVTPDVFASFGQSTTKINQAYADRYGYSFVVDTKDYTQGSRDPRWNKVKAILNVLETMPVGLHPAISPCTQRLLS
jgi:hypothetical protein